MTVFGIDISHFQHGLDLARVKREGYSFVMVKATEGRTFRDADWPGFRDAARAAGLYLAAYHFLRSDSTAAQQAANLAAHLGDPAIPVMIDAETGQGNSKPDLAMITSFRAECESRGLRVSMLYLPPWYWEQIGRPALGAVDLALVASRYGTDPVGFGSVVYPGDTSSRWDGYGGKDVTILQFGSKVTVAGKNLDGNAYRGAEADLAQWFLAPAGAAAADAAGRDRYMSDRLGARPGGGSSSGSGGGGSPGISVPITAGCTITPRIHGSQYFPALKAELNRPGVTQILLAGWWLQEAFSLDGAGAGTRLLDLLKAKAKAGVDVRVLGWVMAPEVLDNVLIGQVNPAAPTASTADAAAILNLNRDTMRFINGLRAEPALADKALLNILSHPAGAVHHKFVLIRGSNGDVGFTGGVDLQQVRWDPLWHDVQAQVTGPVLERFHEVFRQMWNEIQGRPPVRLAAAGVVCPSHTTSTPVLPAPTFSSTGTGAVAVQSLRTVPQFNFPPVTLIAPRNRPVGFAPAGAFELRLAWEKAISGASNYIYLEDQGYTATEVFDWINARVKAAPELRVVLVMGGNDPTTGTPGPQLAAMQLAVNDHLLAGLTAAQRDRVGVFGYWRKFVHAKTTIIDDQWALIGSANCMRRSLYTDFEHCVGFFDPPTVVAYRRALWRTHLGSDIAGLDAALRAWFARPLRPAAPGSSDPITRFRLPLPRPTMSASDRVIYDQLIDADSRQPWGPGLAELGTIASGAGGFSP
jgi:phosphatidylserine/phosphatidylglycerophosphate/cardiolipin synthase-like enzyme